MGISVEIGNYGLISIFEKYSTHNDEPVTRALFEKNLSLKKLSQDFQSDMTALLPANSEWNFNTALKVVADSIISNLKGEPWKRE